MKKSSTVQTHPTPATLHVQFTEDWFFQYFTLLLHKHLQNFC